MTLTHGQIRGCLWAFALGDALGQPVEFNQWEVIRERYGPNGIREPKSWAIWTDDTEFTLAVWRALIRLGPFEKVEALPEDTIGTIFAEEFIKWWENPGYSPGITSKMAVNHLKIHSAASWQKAGNNDSKGCGTVMRASPLGLWCANALAPEIPAGKGPAHDQLARVSAIQSEITHGHKAATAAALAGSYAVALAANGIPPAKMIHPIRQFCNPVHQDFAHVMNRMEDVVARREQGEFRNDVDAEHAIGLGWVGDEAFAMALYAAIRFPVDLTACLRAAVNHSGDSDSVGCIAGSVLGALHGMRIVPSDWVDRLAEKKRMEKVLQEVCSFLN